MLHVTRQAVSNWERDKTLPDIVTLKNMADLTGVTIDDIVSGGRVLPELPPVDRRRQNILYWITVACGVLEIVWQFSFDSSADTAVPVTIVLLITTLMHFLLGGMTKRGNFGLLTGYSNIGQTDFPQMRRLYAKLELMIIADGLIFCIIAFVLARFTNPEFSMPVLLGMYIVAFVSGMIAIFFQHNYAGARTQLESRVAKINGLLIATFVGAVFLCAADLILTIELIGVSWQTQEQNLLIVFLLVFCGEAVAWLLYELLYIRRLLESKKDYRPSGVSWIALGVSILLLTAIPVAASLM